MNLKQRTSNETPNSLLENIAWSFTEPVFYSLSEFIDAVVLYHKEIEEPFNIEAFISKSPLTHLQVECDYGDEEDIFINIDGDGHYLMYAEILWKIHQQVFSYLKDRDHHFFEGLYLISDEDKNQPVYEMYLGS